MRTVYYSLVQDAYKLNGRKTTGKEEQMNVQLTQCTVDPVARPPANRLKKRCFMIPARQYTENTQNISGRVVV